MKPVIGVLPLINTETGQYWMRTGYMKGIQCAGGLPVMLPFTEDKDDIKCFIRMCSGFLFTGGQDISTDMYGEDKLPVCGDISSDRDSLEKCLFEEALDADMPIFGICRGLQFVNVMLGGTLYQDISTQIGTNINHRMPLDEYTAAHDVDIVRDTPLDLLLKKDRITVNSFHHQTVKKLAPSLNVMANAADGIVEAVWSPKNKFLWAVQWHPEYLFDFDNDNANIFRAFVDACR